MSKKQRKVNEATQIQADDFKLINGITRGIEKYLHAADIQTYAQLASLSPQEILSKLGKGKGYSTRRIEEENWVGQAQRLISKKASRKPIRKETSRPAIRQHYENFTIEFLLDDKNLARRTHIVHIQSGDADTWAGWKGEQLFDFIVRHTRVRLPETKLTASLPSESNLLPPPSTLTDQASHTSTETVLVTAVEFPEKNTDPLPSSAAHQAKTQIVPSTNELPLETVSEERISKRDTNSADTIPLLEWKISLPDTDQALRNVPSNQNFEVSITLDLSKVSLPKTSRLDYAVTLHAKKLGGRNRQLIGQIQKTIPFNHTLLLTTQCSPLSQGIYRLEAFVTIGLATAELGQRPRLRSFIESGPIQVY